MSELTLTARGEAYVVPAELDETIVKLAKKHAIPWGHACERGICAQCRTKVIDGADCLNEITPEEKLRLRKAERQDGYRLGCQIRLKKTGRVHLLHSPYR
ncbi:2Fe-2S iron-sulfur cluster-binding protein [Brevibacillus massiliensis]|uniref:2Fe-2S iron-sulfur cluster-binding protein n=1 Tax=Brevibacillus massiliensis TaxID=1118054 RepID=UPI00035CAED3|nr:2Fe-2S iron-sulfur cluster-binding protein [Brevibacillus massiliensis]